ncbi:MAG: class I SAM-dependent methyltransferase [Chitinophagales bacterium]
MIKKWVLKAVVQKVISFLPQSHKINYLFQKYITRGVYLSDDYFYDRLAHAGEHIKAWQQGSGTSAPPSSLEIGTGWYPVVPISFFLSGVEAIYSVDISPLTSKPHLLTTIRKFMEAGEPRLAQVLPLVPERWQELKTIAASMNTQSLDDLLKQLHITYLVADARQLPLDDNSIHLVNSNNTFEHIYPKLLQPILQEFQRVVKKENGVFSHAIDMSDHFAHFDKTISIYHFLRYSENAWKWIDNSVQPQNRCRMCDYEAMYQALNIPISSSTHRKGDVNELVKVPLAAPFKNYSPEANAISHCHLVSFFRKN